MHLLRWKGSRDEAGSSGVEFALIAPVIILILAGIFEIALVIRARFALVSVVSAASSYTLSVGNSIDDGSADGVAATIAALLGGNGRSATVNLNGGVTSNLVGGEITVTNSGGEVSACYCASRSEGQIVWGGTVACGASCGDDTTSGRFVEITARVPFSPAMGMFGFFSGEVVQNTAMVRLP